MIQGDEPMVTPDMVDQAVAPFYKDNDLTIVNLMTANNVAGKQALGSIETVAKELFRIHLAEKDHVKNVTKQVQHAMAERNEILILDQCVRIWATISGVTSSSKKLRASLTSPVSRSADS